MGYKRAKKTFVLEFEDDKDGEFEGLEVEVRSIPTGDFLELSSLAEKENMTDEDVRAMFVAFNKVLVSWNLEDEDDAPVPATLEGLLTLDLEFVMKLVGSWMDVISGPASGSDLGKDSPSGEQFPGQPVTMEAL